MTKEKFKNFGIGIPLGTNEILEMDMENLKREISEGIVKFMQNPKGMKIPKNFDLSSFVRTLQGRLNSDLI